MSYSSVEPNTLVSLSQLHKLYPKTKLFSTMLSNPVNLQQKETKYSTKTCIQFLNHSLGVLPIFVGLLMRTRMP